MSSSIVNGPNSVGKKYPTCIYWFRNALRLHDNPSLLDACNQSNSVLPLFIIDPDEPFSQTHGRKAGCIRANFVLESLRELDDKIRNISILQGQQTNQLFVLVGKPVNILPQIAEKFNIDAIFYEREPAAPTRQADALILDAIQRVKKNEHISIVGYDTHTLHPMEHYVALCKNQVAPSQYGGFTKIFYQLGSVPTEVASVSQIPPSPSHSIQLLKETIQTNIEYNVPSLQSLGYDESCLVNRAKGGLDYKGGEDSGIQLLEKMMKRTQWVCTFEKPNTKPNALTVDTTGLSPCMYFF
jgi:deoxyribodipyrimidine photolyase